MTLDGTQRAEFDSEEGELVGTSATAAVPLQRRLIVALDMPDVDQARKLVDELGDSVNYYKIGLELIFAGGLRLAEELRDSGHWIFLDMKLLDIGNTVEKAVANVSKLGFKFLTVHGLDSKTLEAAIQGRGGSQLGLLAVTVLTNLSTDDLREQGLCEDAATLTMRRARLAHSLGFNGVIASGHEARAIRDATSETFVIKTPGIRPRGYAAQDQSRVMTPREAIANGADYLVVGRPIVRSADPRRVALEITAEIKAELDLRRGL